MHTIRDANDAAAREVTRATTVDHISGRCSVGMPAMAYRRVARPAPRPNYAARRLGAVGALVVGLLVAAQAVGTVAAFFGSSPVLAASDDAERVVAVASLDTHVARDGDSLWSIAEAYRGQVGRESYIDALVELNEGTAVLVGQAVLLPRS